MPTWPRSLPAGSSPTSARRTPTAYARRSTATPTATSSGSAARRSTPVHRADGGRTGRRPDSALLDRRCDDLAPDCRFETEAGASPRSARAPASADNEHRRGLLLLVKRKPQVRTAHLVCAEPECYRGVTEAEWIAP